MAKPCLGGWWRESPHIVRKKRLLRRRHSRPRLQAPPSPSRIPQNGPNSSQGRLQARAGSQAFRKVGDPGVRPFHSLLACWGADLWSSLVCVRSVEVKDISLTDYIQIRHAVYLPHTAGRYAKKQFKKAQMPIVERLVDRCVGIEHAQIVRPGTHHRLCAVVQLDDEGPQQRKEALGRSDCRTRVRDHPPAHRPEPHPGSFSLRCSQSESQDSILVSGSC